VGGGGGGGVFGKKGVTPRNERATRRGGKKERGKTAREKKEVEERG